MATISEVAARAGVSTATVSRALNGKPTVDRTWSPGSARPPTSSATSPTARPGTCAGRRPPSSR
ncbi:MULTISPECIES: LacI family DNA-binding transcriptional regulator [unclassified Kribbella]|uniref:LacI family DNA-binding transcriptional regulator n=1 Tax=unclassified Kribbella TaxID=2644121 RepID=UPI003018C56D